jgi:hypothetical protein
MSGDRRLKQDRAKDSESDADATLDRQKGQESADRGAQPGAARGTRAADRADSEERCIRFQSEHFGIAGRIRCSESTGALLSS